MSTVFRSFSSCLVEIEDKVQLTNVVKILIQHLSKKTVIFKNNCDPAGGVYTPYTPPPVLTGEQGTHKYDEKAKLKTCLHKVVDGL